MKPYNSINRNLLEIGDKIYRIVRYLGDIWLIEECNTNRFFILDRSEDYFFLIRKKSLMPPFVFSDLIIAGFTEESSYSLPGHVFKLLRCKENQCLYVADIDIEEVKYISRVPSNTAEILLHPKSGKLVGVFYEALNVLHVEDGKFVQ